MWIHNKRTQILSQIDDGSTALTNHADVAAAKSFFYTVDALAVFDECCTNLQWGLKADGSGNNTILVVTFDFGTKGTAGISEADDWAGQFTSRRQALVDSSGWMADHFSMASADSSSHLF